MSKAPTTKSAAAIESAVYKKLEVVMQKTACSLFISDVTAFHVFINLNTKYEHKICYAIQYI